MKSKHVKFYLISEFISGIISVQFTMIKRSVTCLRLSETIYQFYDTETGDSDLQEIELLPFKIGKFYINAQLQSELVITYFYIPFDLIERSIIVHEISN